MASFPAEEEQRLQSVLSLCVSKQWPGQTGPEPPHQMAGNSSVGHRPQGDSDTDVFCLCACDMQTEKEEGKI